MRILAFLALLLLAAPHAHAQQAQWETETNQHGLIFLGTASGPNDAAPLIFLICNPDDRKVLGLIGFVPGQIDPNAFNASGSSIAIKFSPDAAPARPKALLQEQSGRYEVYFLATDLMNGFRSATTISIEVAGFGRIGLTDRGYGPALAQFDRDCGL